MDNLFSPSASVKSERILYTPTSFAKTSLLHLQEVGTLYAVKPHTSSRSNLASFLCFAVREGEGELVYEKEHFRLKAGDCVFLNCEKLTATAQVNISGRFPGAIFIPSLCPKYMKSTGKGAADRYSGRKIPKNL